MITNSTTDCEKYLKLEITNDASIKKSDLPSEFCEESYLIVDEFIKKTANLNYEILIYFDYLTGELINCKIGRGENIIFSFNEDDFKEKHVASLHNHTKEMYTPPSDKNFGIFSRDWEDYELIAGWNCLWILKGKIKDNNLVKELRIESRKLFISSHSYCSRRFENINEINDKCDELYGKRLSNYINNKKIIKYA